MQPRITFPVGLSDENTWTAPQTIFVYITPVKEFALNVEAVEPESTSDLSTIDIKGSVFQLGTNESSTKNYAGTWIASLNIASFNNLNRKYMSRMIAGRFNALNASNGNVNEMNAIVAELTSGENGSATTLGRAIVVPACAITNGGDSISTFVGLDIEDQTAATDSNIALRTGKGIVNFGDSVYFSPSAGLNFGSTTLMNYQQGTWTPFFTNLTIVNGTGAVTITGSFTRIGNVVLWQAAITTTGTATTSSTAGVTFINNLPFNALVINNCQASNGTSFLGLGTGHVVGIKAYPPSWAATGNTIVITGTITL